ncbi:metal ABC transporter substrate-binding protein [Desulfovibrio inopinatus]|uniref:metal ABC transporter substrate-binding protein n=1 Tax=Desulfovibrio inopinatus TaxID=102109 RepID=UPI000403454F|nr:metal ABC transporter substrate-binding protein [Desulfovibrio inopinatus]
MIRIVVLIVGVALCQSVSVYAADDCLVVTSTTQTADFARQVAGDDCRVKSILAPGADPHTYMPTPADAALVREADLCLQNGLNLEGNNWMGKLAHDAGKPVVILTTGIAPLETQYEGHAILDPHAWFSPQNAAVYVKNARDALVELDPEKASNFKARANLYLRELRVLDGWMKAEFNSIPPRRRILVTSHDAFNYFCRAFFFNPQNNYLSLAPVGWSTGSEVGAGMTPARRAQVVSSIQASGAPAIFVETSVNPKLIREIAREAGVAIGGKLYSDSMGNVDSAGETYIGMMRENTLTIVNALRKDDR